MAKKSSTRARKAPSQERSRHLVETMLDATTRLLVQDDWETLSTNQVAKRAGVSVGSLYQYFPNKEALLGELARRHLSQMLENLDVAFGEVASIPLADGAKRLLEVVFATVARNRLLWRRLILRADTLGIGDARRAYEERCKQLIKSHLAAKRSELRPDLDEELAAWFIVHQSMAVIERFLTDPDSATPARIIDEMTFALTTYLSSSRKA